MKKIYVLICENEVTAKKIINDHFKSEEVTYAAQFGEELHPDIVRALDTIEE